MSDYYLGQIMLTGFGFAPKTFAQCNGQVMSINQNQALFSLLGTQFGGNGVTTFCLPDLRSRTPVGYGQSADGGWTPPGYQMGEIGGAETVTLLPNNLPAHSHVLNATNTAGTARNPNNAVYGTTTELIHGPSGNLVALAATDVSMAGSSQPHANIQPYLVLNFNIALSGIYPTRS